MSSFYNLHISSTFFPQFNLRILDFVDDSMVWVGGIRKLYFHTTDIVVQEAKVFSGFKKVRFNHISSTKYSICKVLWQHYVLLLCIFSNKFSKIKCPQKIILLICICMYRKVKSFGLLIKFYFSTYNWHNLDPGFAFIAWDNDFLSMCGIFQGEFFKVCFVIFK